MPTKVLWLSLALTLVYWLGSAGGCAAPGDDQNYRELERDRQMFQPESEQRSLGRAEAGEDEPLALGEQESPSLSGLDRAHWPRMRVGPASGTTRHLPVYFETCAWCRASDEIRAGATGDALSPQLGDAEYRAFDAAARLDTVLEPLGAAVDMVLLPVRLVVRPPWTTQTTP